MVGNDTAHALRLIWLMVKRRPLLALCHMGWRLPLYLWWFGQGVIECAQKEWKARYGR